MYVYKIMIDRKRNSEVIPHVLFWIVWVIILNSVTLPEFVGDQGSRVFIDENGSVQTIPSLHDNGASSALPFLLLGLVIKIPLFYSMILWLFPKMAVEKEYGKFGVYSLFFIALGFLADMLLSYLYVVYVDGLGVVSNINWVSSSGGTSTSLGQTLLEVWAPVNAVHYVVLFAFGLGYIFFKQWSLSEKKREDLEQEKLAAQLKFLKSQVNPHFLFNTLNNLFSLAQASKNDELSGGIAKLSGMMRYMLFYSSETKVPLQKEIDYLHEYMELEQLRVNKDDDIDISFEISGEDISGYEIAPLLLIPFVENAYKHGIDPTELSVIDITLDVTEHSLNFKVKNRKHRTRDTINEHESGIGLKNVKKRLELVYPGRHKLDIIDGDEHFESELNIQW